MLDRSVSSEHALRQASLEATSCLAATGSTASAEQVVSSRRAV
jgi:hypothetical protein